MLASEIDLDTRMVKIFKRDPIKKLEAEYKRLLIEARDLQRNGDVLRSAQVTAEAEEIGKQIDELRCKT